MKNGKMSLTSQKLDDIITFVAEIKMLLKNE